MSAKQYYSIGNASLMCTMPVKTLRYYDEIKLIEPTYRNEETGYRYYDKKQLCILLMVKKLKYLGFSLDEIRDLIREKDTGFVEKSVESKLLDIAHRIEVLRDKQIEGRYFLERLQKGTGILNNPTLEGLLDQEAHRDTVALETIAPIDVLFTRKMRMDYKNEEVNIDRWAEILDLAERKKAIPIGAISITYHNGVLEQFFKSECDYEVHIQVERPGNTGEFKRFGGFKAATTFHVGGYADIISAHLRVLKWISDHGYAITGNTTEEFIISPIDTNNEQEYLSKIIIPVEQNPPVKL